MFKKFVKLLRQPIYILKFFGFRTIFAVFHKHYYALLFMAARNKFLALIIKVNLFFKVLNLLHFLAVTNVANELSVWNDVVVTPLEKAYSPSDMEPFYGLETKAEEEEVMVVG